PVTGDRRDVLGVIGRLQWQRHLFDGIHVEILLRRGVRHVRLVEAGGDEERLSLCCSRSFTTLRATWPSGSSSSLWFVACQPNGTPSSAALAAAFAALAAFRAAFSALLALPAAFAFGTSSSSMPRCGSAKTSHFTALA